MRTMNEMAVTEIQEAVAPKPLHFSNIKALATSAAHFRYALDHPKPMTGPMLAGMLLDRLLTGGKVPPVYPGSDKGNMNRQGNAWKDWVTSCGAAFGWKPDELPTLSEMDEAHTIAAVVRKDPLAMEYLTGRPQVPLEWETMGVRRVTRGIDVVGGGWISDLKLTADAKPDRLMRHAESMLWHAQLADYREACRQNGIDTSKGVYLVAIESRPPYVSTVLEITDAMLEEGEACVHKWIEKYKGCVASGHWPGYSQVVEKWEPWSVRQGQMPQLIGFEEESASDGDE